MLVVGKKEKGMDLEYIQILKAIFMKGNWKSNLKNGKGFLFTIIRIDLKESGKTTLKMEKENVLFKW